MVLVYSLHLSCSVKFFMFMVCVWFSCFIAFLVVILVFVASIFISSRSFYNREKSSSFECGFDSMVLSRVPFSLRFFLLTIVFLVFDVEVVLFIPMCMSFMFSDMIVVFICSLFFILVLLIGLFNEWLEGSLSWI
uniref:NADH-ubiquinone oxidoreductase chain 3 n=1 Tax=Viana regina TaxID=1882667 RepID=A0A1B2G3F7_9GAST|nr:NADH dehydrogenase subunit 3 [Viana regina]